MTMIELFAKPLTDLALEDLRSFLAGVDDDEGVTWEAKADEDKRRGKVTGDEPGELYPTTIHKAVSAFANQIGGYLIVGARWDKDAREWLLPGVKVREHEAAAWLSKVIGAMQPAPRFSPPLTWRLNDDGEEDAKGERVVAVVWIDPVDEPPCMTPQGRIYERVSGDSLPVKDPALLDALMRRGRERRDEAERFAREAARRALELPAWEPSWSVRLALALAPFGRETTDISSRLFVESFRAELTGALVNLRPRTPIDGDRLLAQDMLALTAHIGASHGEPFEERQAVRWSTWAYGALWTGAAFASATLGVRATEETDTFASFARPGWHALAGFVKRLGGYGPAHLTLLVRVAPEPREIVDGKAVAWEAQPAPAESHSLFGRLERGSTTAIERTVGVDDEPSDDMLSSMRRELSRAAGIHAWEPES